MVEKKKRTRRSAPIDIYDGLIDLTPVSPAQILMPSEIPISKLDNTPLSATDVRRFRDILGCTTTQFAKLFGCSRQRVYDWETQGTSKAHPAVTMLMRLYYATVPAALHDPDDVFIGSFIGADEAPEVAPEVAEVAPEVAEVTPDEAPEVERKERGGVRGFGWWREGERVYYKSPYQADVARALERTKGASWHKKEKIWALPDEEQSVQLLEGLVREHWTFELDELVVHIIDDVARSSKVARGELVEIAAPGQRSYPEGLWGRVVTSWTEHECDDGWIDQHNLCLVLTRAPASDPGVAEQLDAHKNKVDGKAAALAAWEQRKAAEQARVEQGGVPLASSSLDATTSS
jgi:DNA-binding transcriptional regulator YiaG